MPSPPSASAPQPARPRRGNPPWWRAAGRGVALVVLTLLAVGLGACDLLPDEEPVVEVAEPLPPPVERDMAAIREEGVLRALVTTDSTSYFLYRGTPMGYDYALLLRFARAQDLKLEMVLVRDREDLIRRLNAGEGDIAAARLVPDYDDAAPTAYTVALYETSPVLVQRESLTQSLPQLAQETLENDRVFDPENSDELMRPRELSVRPIRRRSELAGRDVAVPEGSVYSDRALELFDLETDDVEIVEVEDAGSFEDLIRDVAEGRVRLGASPRNLAELKESYYTNIVVYPTLGPTHQVAWAVRRTSPELRTALNGFLAEDGELPRFDDLYEKYFIDRQGYVERVDSEYLTSVTGTLSDYDDLLRRYAPEIDWDWRLLASQTYQESRFKPRAKSWAGAAGLLQLMPATARQFKVTDRFDPEQNVAGAVRFLRWQENYWDDKIPDPEERLRFILASYNAGHGHVQDARRLAEKHGDDPESWDDVAYWMLQLAKKEVYSDPVVAYGYCRGLEPVTYVDRILNRWRHYQLFVDPEDGGGPETEQTAGALDSRRDAT